MSKIVDEAIRKAAESIAKGLKVVGVTDDIEYDIHKYLDPILKFPVPVRAAYDGLGLSQAEANFINSVANG